MTAITREVREVIDAARFLIDAADAHPRPETVPYRVASHRLRLALLRYESAPARPGDPGAWGERLFLAGVLAVVVLLAIGTIWILLTLEPVP